MTSAPLTTTVDADIFDGLEDAIDFVASHGGGVVHTEAWATEYGKSLVAPYKGKVELKPASARTGECSP